MDNTRNSKSKTPRRGWTRTASTVVFFLFFSCFFKAWEPSITFIRASYTVVFIFYNHGGWGRERSVPPRLCSEFSVHLQNSLYSSASWKLHLHGTKTHGLLQHSGASHAVQSRVTRETVSSTPGSGPARALGRGLTNGGIVSLGRSFLNCQNPRGSEGAKREELICSWPWR